MNITLVKQLLLHQDLMEILEKIKKNGQKPLGTVHHNVKEIHRVIERVRKDAEHRGWDTLWVVTYCHKCPEQYVSSHHCPSEFSLDWFYFIGNPIHYELENDKVVNKTEVYNSCTQLG